MTRDEVITGVAQKCETSKKLAAEFVNAFLEQITEGLSEGKKVSFVGFGTFEVRHRNERKGINPQTREPIIIPARNVPVFKAGKNLREAVK